MTPILEALGENQCLLFCAPPGYGKTYRILECLKESKLKIIFVMPLRALCQEVLSSALKKNIDTALIKEAKKQKLILATNESFNLYQSQINTEDYIIVMDEFHLIYHWGDSFRIALQESWQNIAVLNRPVLLLSATMDLFKLARFKQEASLNFTQTIIVDIGNLTLKNYPKRVHYYPALYKRYLINHLIYNNCKGVKLIFCRYRNEVKSYANILRKKGFKVLDCVGGEAKIFIKKLEQNTNIDFIIATNVISHGVNLPDIQSVGFTYKVDDFSQYLQMTGRGGRENNEFECIGMNRDLLSSQQLVFNFIMILFISFKIRLRKIFIWT